MINNTTAVTQRGGDGWRATLLLTVLPTQLEHLLAGLLVIRTGAPTLLHLLHACLYGGYGT